MRPYIRSILVSWTQTQSKDLIHRRCYDNGQCNGMLDKRKQPDPEFFLSYHFMLSLITHSYIIAPSWTGIYYIDFGNTILFQFLLFLEHFVLHAIFWWLATPLQCQYCTSHNILSILFIFAVCNHWVYKQHGQVLSGIYHTPAQRSWRGGYTGYTPAQRSWRGGYTGFTLSVRPSVRLSVCPSVCRRHGFRSISQVCFGISISNFICMLMVAIGRSLLIFRDVTFKMAAWLPYWIFWFPDSNFTLALNINFKLQWHNIYVYGLGAYWFSATSFSKWPPGGHIRFFGFWTL